MSTSFVTVEAKVVGQKKPLFTGWRTPIPNRDGSTPITLRDLITAIVLKEVEAFKQRQEQRRLEQIFTAEQIQQGAERGRINIGGREDFTPQEVDEQAAVGAALQAFEDGLYYVFLDDAQQESLDQQVFVGDDSRVLFVRLIALAGG
jgi:hypothetical protein